MTIRRKSVTLYVQRNKNKNHNEKEKKGRDRMKRDLEQYFDERRVVQERNAELIEEKFKECKAYVESVLKNSSRIAV